MGILTNKEIAAMGLRKQDDVGEGSFEFGMIFDINARDLNS